jgi:hypothetical protein
MKDRGREKKGMAGTVVEKYGKKEIEGKKEING